MINFNQDNNYFKNIPLEFDKIPQAQFNFIEANAGTGKTYSIIEIFKYFLLRSPAPVRLEEILILSFTDNAVNELKVRVKPWIKSDNFSLNQIYTFHSFCYKLLSEYRIESQQPFSMSINNHLEQEITFQAQEYFYQQNLLIENDFFLEFLEKEKYLKKMFSSLEEFNKKIDLKPFPEKAQPISNEQLIKKINNYQQQKVKITTLLQQNYDSYLNQLLHLNLNRIKYKKIKEKFIFLYDYFNQKYPNRFYPLYNQKDDENNYLLIFFSLKRLEKNLKDDLSTPKKPLLTFLNELGKFRKQLEGLKICLKEKYFFYCQQGIKVQEKFSNELKNKLKVLTYNDLIKKVDLLLKDSNFATIFKNKYKVILVDEFQDTDLIQIKLIQKIVEQNPLAYAYFIGDPKQSIYGFRNANLKTYLEFRDRNHQGVVHVLNTNYRSTIKLIQAVNVLYKSCENPFDEKNINYLPSQPDPKRIDNVEFEQPVRIKELSKERLSLSEIKEKIAADVVKELMTFPIEEINKTCILVRKNSEILLITQELFKHNIPFLVLEDRGEVNLLEIQEIILLMKAIIDFNDERSIKAFLVTSFFNFSPEKINSLSGKEMKSLFERFFNLFQKWKQQGVFNALYSFLKDFDHSFLFGINKNVLKQIKLNKYLGIFNSLNDFEKEYNFSPIALYCFYKKNFYKNLANFYLIQENDFLNQKVLLVMTVHKSKGLEFKNVILPFLVFPIDAKGRPIIFCPTKNNSNKNYFLDLGSDLEEENRKLSSQELFKEELRILYVALTRAKDTLLIYYWKIKKKNSLNYLINLEQLKENKENDYFKIETLDLDQDLGEVVGLKGLEEKKQVFYQFKNSFLNHKIISLNQLEKPLTSRGYLASFSSIKNDINDWDFNRNNQFHPLKNKATFSYSFQNWSEDISPKLSSIKNELELPRGTNTGKCLHAILEKWDGNQNKIYNQVMVRKELVKYGLAVNLEKSVLDFLNSITEMDFIFNSQNFRVSFRQVAIKNNWLKEMEFYLAVKKTKKEIIQHFLNLLHEQSYLSTNSIKQVSLINPWIDDLVIEDGFLKGFIDLIFIQNGRYYLIDWKSNFLGNRKQDYAREKIKDYLLDKNYFLQAFIYTLAMDVFLERRLGCDYSYEEKFGGVFYIFLRNFFLDLKTVAKTELADITNGYYSFKFEKKLIEKFKKDFIL